MLMSVALIYIIIQKKKKKKKNPQQKRVSCATGPALVSSRSSSPLLWLNKALATKFPPPLKMPLKWLLYWQTNPGTSVSTQILTEVSQCVEGMNASKGGRWKSTVNYYRPNTRDPSMPIPPEFPRELMGVSLQEQPNKHYFILRGQRIVVESDTMITTIMEKLQSYRSRIAITFEGFQYQLGDFQLRLGKAVATTADNVRGIVMEIEYLPISSLEKSRQIMEEFLDMWQEIVLKRSLPGRFVHVEPSFGEYGLHDHYTSQHTVVQYASVTGHLFSAGRN